LTAECFSDGLRNVAPNRCQLFRGRTLRSIGRSAEACALVDYRGARRIPRRKKLVFGCGELGQELLVIEWQPASSVQSGHPSVQGESAFGCANAMTWPIRHGTMSEPGRYVCASCPALPRPAGALRARLRPPLPGFFSMLRGRIRRTTRTRGDLIVPARNDGAVGTLSGYEQPSKTKFAIARNWIRRSRRGVANRIRFVGGAHRACRGHGNFGADRIGLIESLVREPYVGSRTGF
jgi:hypothetical protein